MKIIEPRLGLRIRDKEGWSTQLIKRNGGGLTWEFWGKNGERVDDISRLHKGFSLNYWGVFINKLNESKSI